MTYLNGYLNGQSLRDPLMSEAIEEKLAASSGLPPSHFQFFLLFLSFTGHLLTLTTRKKLNLFYPNGKEVSALIR